MSEAVDLQHLFQLDQVLVVDDGGGQVGGGCGAGGGRVILSHDVSQCGRTVVFVAGRHQPASPPKEASLGAWCRAGTDTVGSWIPWFEDADLSPTAVSLSTENDFCLVGCVNGALYVVPVRVLCPAFDPVKHDPNAKEWTRKKITAVNVRGAGKRVFGSLDRNDGEAVAGTQANVPTTRCTYPTSILWWTTQDLHSMAVVGTRSGWVVIVDLIDGKEIGYVRPSHHPIVKMEEITDNALDCTYLFITDEEHKQWRVLLERRSTGFSWCNANELASGRSRGRSPHRHQRTDSGSEKLSAGKQSHNSSTEDLSAAPRSRLAGLKSMSVASLASLRQKLSEGRKMWDKKIYATADSGQLDDVDGLGQCNSSLNMGEFIPEPLNTKVGGTRLSVQRAFKGHHQQCVLGGLFPETAILTIHNSDLEVLPQVAFRLPRQTERVLVLDKLMLASSSKRNEEQELKGDSLKIISEHYAEIHADSSKSKEEPVIQSFVLSDGERVKGIWQGVRPPQILAEASKEDDDEAGDTTSSSSGGLSSSSDEISDPRKTFLAETKKKVDSTKRKSQRLFQECLVVTNKAIYVLKLDRDPVTTFLESAMQGEIKIARKIAATFDLDSRALLELAADIRLCERDFAEAIGLYRLSGCKHLKAVLKFAASGHVQELLSYLSVLFKTPNLDVSVPDKIKLSNLTLMAFFHQVLGEPSGDSLKREELRLRIKQFLADNFLLDETLAVRLALETREWNLLGQFCAIRGLFKQMMEGICGMFKVAYDVKGMESSYYGKSQTLQEITAAMVSEMSANERRGLTSCLTHMDILISLCDDHGLARSALKIINGIFPFLTLEQFKMISRLADPGQPGFCPVLKAVLCDDNSSSSPSVDDFAKELLEFHVNVELTISKQTCGGSGGGSKGSSFDQDLIRMQERQHMTVPCSKLDEVMNKLKPHSCRILAAGPSHAMYIKQDKLYSWGSAQDGILGHSEMSKFGPPKEVEFFHNVNRSPDQQQKPSSSSAQIRVISAGCGKSHSLVLTDCGLYSWGSSKYGQLGLGRERPMTKQPELIKTLSNRVITSFSCGHYHTVALDSTNRVWTWGWGVHGQLGLGDIEDEHLPIKVKHKELNLEGVCRVAAGYAHTMVSTYMGNVWVFGCGMFGQLGNGTNKKSTFPVKVDLNRTINGTVTNDRIDIIGSGHFHNLAVSHDGLRLYTWGCNPQMLRMEAQAKKKERLLKNLRKDEESEAGQADHDAKQPDQKKEAEEEEKEGEMLHLLPSIVDTSIIEGKIIAVSGGNQHTLILYDHGQVYSYGRNVDGQLGIGSRKESKLPNIIVSLKDDEIIDICCYGDYSLALNERGTVFAWGNNSAGQLGKPPLESDTSTAMGKVPGPELNTLSGKVMLLNSKRVQLHHSLQNSCDVPKPILGLNTGEVYSDECYDRDKLQETALAGLKAQFRTVSAFRHLRLKVPNDHRKHKVIIHRTLETFSQVLDAKKVIKRCLMLDNLQAAAKISLLSKSNAAIFEAFEFTLQSIIKQVPAPENQLVLSEQIFDAYDFYLHFGTSTRCGESGTSAVAAATDGPDKKAQLTERLIACWQDLKFSFSQLEELFRGKLDDPAMVQVLVLTLFCPEDERSTKSGPTLEVDRIGKRTIVDLFTPEFCLKIGDVFVNTLKEEEDNTTTTTTSNEPSSVQNFDIAAYDHNGKQQQRKLVVSRWLERQRSKVEDEKANDVDEDDVSKNLTELVQGLIVADRPNSDQSDD